LTLGPGHYDPKNAATVRKAPSVSFGMIGGV